MNYFLKVVKSYAQFKGRGTRSEYWYYVLFYVLFGFLAMGIDYLLGTAAFGTGMVYFIYILALFLPSLECLSDAFTMWAKVGGFL